MKKTYQAYDELFSQLKKIAVDNNVSMAPELALTAQSSKISLRAVVPLDQFDEAYSIVKLCQPTDVSVKPILTYFENTWIYGSFPVADWNYFGVYADRTNNNVEALDKLVNSKLKSSHPTLYKFIDFIKSEENRMQISLYQY